jgi:hypothetical protein
MVFFIPWRVVAEDSGAAHFDLLGPPGWCSGCWPHARRHHHHIIDRPEPESANNNPLKRNGDVDQQPQRRPGAQRGFRSGLSAPSTP